MVMAGGLAYGLCSSGPFKQISAPGRTGPVLQAERRLLPDAGAGIGQGLGLLLLAGLLNRRLA